VFADNKVRPFPAASPAVSLRCIRLDWLPVRRRIEFKVVCLAHQLLLSGQAPGCLACLRPVDVLCDQPMSWHAWCFGHKTATMTGVLPPPETTCHLLCDPPQPWTANIFIWRPRARCSVTVFDAYSALEDLLQVLHTYLRTRTLLHCQSICCHY